MAKATRSRHRSRARKLETAPSQRQADISSALAQRDLLAAILDAASENGGLEKYLCQVVEHLGQYSKCSSIGILLFQDDEIAGCRSCHGGAAEFQRASRSSFPGSETCICNAIAKLGSDTRPSYLTESGAFFRNSKPNTSARTETADGAFGICIGSIFESVALIPIRHPKTVMGFILVGDEGQDKIPLKTVKFLERVGTYVGSTVRSLGARDKLRQSEPGLPGPAEETATASHGSDEMELVIRLIENSNESIVISQDWRIIYVNNKCAEMAGLSKEDMVGLAFLDITHPDDRPAVIERYSKLLSGEWLSHGTTVRGLDKDGNTRWAELREIPFSWHGRPAIMSLVNDITDRKMAEEALEKSERHYRLLADNTTDVIWVTDLNLKPTYFSPSVFGLMGYSGEEALGGTLDTRLTPASAKAAAKVFAGALTREKETPGTTTSLSLELELKRKDGSTVWVETTVSFMRDSKGQAVGVLGTMRDISDRKKADEALEASEARFRTLIEESTDAIAILDGSGNLLYESPSMERVTGYRLEDWQGKPVGDWLLHPDDMAAMASLLERLIGHPELKGEEVRVRFKHKDGTWHFLEGTVRNFLGDPNVNGLVINYRDVTERVEADQALRESEARFRALAENSSDMIVLLDRNAVISYESPATTPILGLSPQERIGERPFERVHPDDLPKATEAFGKLMVNPGAGPMRIDELRLQHKDGSWRTMEATGSTVLRDGSVEGIVVTLHDITDRKKADEALKASEERFRTIIENARDAITIVDENFGVIYESPSLATVTGYRPDEWVGKSLGDMSIHPDDIPMLASKFELLKSQPGSVIEDLSVRYLHRDGSWHVIEASGRNLLHDPRVNGIVVNFRDSTARRRMEEALRESELRYRLLAENASDVIFTSDLAMKLTYVSPSIAQLTGRTPEETMSLNADGWIAPASREFVSKAFSWAIDKAKSGIDLPPALRTASLEMSKKEGGTVWAEIRIAFLRDANGQPVGILGMARDITDRRIAEMELERRVQLEMLITEISTAFIGISTDYIDQGIRNAMESISGLTGVDRSYIFMFSEDRTRMNLSHEWCSEGIEPLIGGLHPVPANSLPFLVDRIKAAEYIHIPDLADLPATAEAERALLQRQGVQSAIVVPMVQSGHAIGFFGLSSIRSKKTWDEETISLLRLVAEMFSNALERKRMDLALRESEKRYRLLAENVTDVIWTTDIGLRVNYMSPSGVRLVGFSQEEYMNLTLEDMLTPSSFQDGMRAFAEQQAISSARQDTSPLSWTLEVQLRCKDGSTIWAEETVTFLRDQSGNAVGLLGVTRDIRERKKVEGELRMSEEKHRTLVEASPDGVLSIDGRGIITECNTGLCRMLGYEKEELRGKEARILGTRKDLDAEAYYSAHLAQGEFLEVETEILRRDGQTLPVWAKLVRLAEPKTAGIHTVIYFRDIADRRKIDEMKDEFVGLVSHELRSPLTVIIGALNTAISEGPRLSQKETRQLLEDAAFEAEQLSHLVGNLLELSRAQANRLFLHVEPVNLAKAAHKVIESIERQSSKHKFIVDLPRKLPSVSADQLRLERILYNLLENGVKYSPEGSEIKVSAKRDAGHLVVSVSDQGPGISKEDQAKLFKPFQQLGNPMLDHTKGAGLGLLVCRRLVEAHGGRIWIESEPGHGATFHFTLQASTKDSPDVG